MRSQAGQTTLEYALICLLVVLGTFGAVKLYQAAVKDNVEANQRGLQSQTVLN